MYVYTMHTHRNVHTSVYTLYMHCMRRGLCAIESCVVVLHSVSAEVRPKDLQKSVYQCRVMGNRGSGKVSRE